MLRLLLRTNAMHDALISRVDELAGRLLTAAEGAVSLQDKIAVLKEVGVWVAIKHRVMEESRRGTQPNYARKRRGFEDDSSEVQRQRALKRWGRKSDVEPDYEEGSELAAFRARLPRNFCENQS
jgi:hypothetical protein